MSSAAVAMNPKKRSAPEAGGIPAPKKVARDAIWPAVAPMGGVPGWQYPPLPMSMMTPMPYCMPGNPFFPFMGMFPPFWLPAAAMAAATMPALAAASAASAHASTVPNVPAACSLQPSTAMWPMMACGALAQPVAQPVAITAAAVGGLARTCSGVSSAVAVPSTSCTNSVPTVGGIQSPASPPPLAASPVSVCNDSSEHPPEDDEFASFIDSFLRSGDGDLAEAAITSGLKMFQPWCSGGSNCSDNTVDEDPCLTRSDSQSLLTMLGDDMGL